MLLFDLPLIPDKGDNGIFLLFDRIVGTLPAILAGIAGLIIALRKMDRLHDAMNGQQALVDQRTKELSDSACEIAVELAKAQTELKWKDVNNAEIIQLQNQLHGLVTDAAKRNMARLDAIERRIAFLHPQAPATPTDFRPDPPTTQ